MYSNSVANRHGFSRLLREPIVLTPAETKRVAGGSVHKNDNSGPGSAPYNTPGNPDYGQNRPTPGAGGGDDKE
jgi:hypothetical protein